MDKTLAGFGIAALVFIGWGFLTLEPDKTKAGCKDCYKPRTVTLKGD